MDNTLLILILGIQAALLTALAIIFLVAARKVFTFIREVKVWVDAHGDQAGRILTDAETLASVSREAGENIRQASAELRSIAETANLSALEVAEAVQHTRDRALLQIDRIDDLLTQTIHGVETAAENLSRRAGPRFSEIAAIFKGIYVSLEYLRGNFR